MKYARILIFVLAASLLLAACAPAPAPAPVQEVPPPAPVVEQPVQPPPEPPPAAPQEPPAPQFAPFCQTAPSACTPPTIELRDNAFCVEKIPYAIMAVPAGTTYESLDPALKCQDQATSDGSLRITCHSGKELWSYNLKVCNPSCQGPSLLMDTGQCPSGYGFDAAGQCCAAPAPAGEEAGCVIYQVDIGGCPTG